MWDVGEPDCVEPSRFHDYTVYSAWMKKNTEALLAIRSSCGPETIPQISGIKTAKEAWRTLEAKFNQQVPIRMESQGRNQSNEIVEVITLDLLRYYPKLTLGKDVHVHEESPSYAAAGALTLFRRNQATFRHGICDQIKSIKWQKSMNSSNSPSDKLFVPMETAIISPNVPVYDALFEATMWRNANFSPNVPVYNALFEATMWRNANFVVTLLKRNTQTAEEFDDMWLNIESLSNISNPQRLDINFDEVKISAYRCRRLTTHDALECFSGPAIHMQRQLQWLTEMEKLVPPSALTSKNLDHKTPAEFFTVSHKDLREAGEKRMKDFAFTCAFVATLIITLMFVAGFQFPGGTDQNTGFPIFLCRKLFKVYLISVAMSLFSATTSALMSLNLLTSNYSEEEFLKSLPNNMRIGLFTLCLSIATMIIAFCSGLYLSLAEN